MSQELHISELIEHYLSGDMPKEEQLSFEKKMAEDPELANLVEETQLTNEALHWANLAVLKESVGKDIEKIPHRSNSGIKKTALISASLLLAGSLAYVLIPKQDTETFQKPEIEQTKQTKLANTKSVKTNNTDKIEVVKSTPEPKKNDIEITPSEEKKEAPKTKVATTKTVEPTEKKVPTTSKVDEKPAANEAVAVSGSEQKEKPQTKTVVSPDVKPQKTENEVIPCDRTFDISSTPSCEEEATGSITIHLEEITGYQFQLDGYNESVNQFYDLAAGNHQLVIKYAECTFQKVVSVPEKWCGYNKSYSFNPEYGEKWELQYPAEEEGSFTVYNARGREVYKTNFGNGNEYWDGKDLSGNPAPVGSYFALIKYANNQVERVELTIVR